MDNAYQWVPFYEALADKLLTYSNKRDELFALMKKLSSEQPLMKYLHFEREDWWGPRHHQIDPFSVIGVMNRGTTDANRIVLAKVLANAFDIQMPSPTQFAGIPVLNNMNSFFNGINELWELFCLAIKSAETGTFSDEFKKAFDDAIAVNGNGLAYITMGLYWIRPHVFMPLDGNSRAYISTHFGVSAPSGQCSGEEYVTFLNSLKTKIHEQAPDLTLPEISYTAWTKKDANALNGASAATEAVDEKQQRAAFKQWYMNNVGSSNSANTISTAISKARLKNGRAVFAIADFNELDSVIKSSSLEGYFQASGGDYSKMDIVFDIDPATQRDDLKSGIKYYLSFLKSIGELSSSSVATRQTGGVKMAKNIILYGTPGTGKTYSTVQYAVAIIEEKSLTEVKSEDYGEVFNRYLKYKEDGLIAFTTFHQSFGYEEFIEGICPVVSSEEKSEAGREIEYEIHDGIFKAFCDSAIHGKASNNEENFEKAWNALIAAAKQNGNQYIFKRQTGSQIQTQLVSDTTFRVNWQSEQNAHNDLTMTTIVKQWLSSINRDSLSGGSRWLYDARQAVIDELKQQYGLKYVEPQAFKRNRVFIIDEINRGNISKIFGELITLIEPSKRIGASEQLRALLPYSGQNFGVPDNVYIIGTMNTADRSIAMIDTALRRRFEFIEMQPDSATLKDVLVDGIDIAEMLDTINKRITVLLDREHTIGHSYLLPLKADPTIENLASIFENRIIPLLQEYFYDDYEKIQLVLGDNQKPDDSTRFIVKKTDAVKLFGNADVDFPEYYEVNSEAFMRIDAYAFL
jgi:5-methylcytosine-specific restriction protein B